MNTERITFRIPSDLKRRMVDETTKRGATITAFVREALEQELLRSARVRVELARERDLNADNWGSVRIRTPVPCSEPTIDLTKEDP